MPLRATFAWTAATTAPPPWTDVGVPKWAAQRQVTEGVTAFLSAASRSARHEEHREVQEHVEPCRPEGDERPQER